MVDHAAQTVITSRPFSETMQEARELWTNYLAVEDDETKEYRFSVMKEIVRKIFGNADFKLATATPGQQDLVELYIEEMKDIIK